MAELEQQIPEKRIGLFADGHFTGRKCKLGQNVLKRYLRNWNRRM